MAKPRIVILSALFISILFCACHESGGLPRVRAKLINPNGSTIPLSLEVADDNNERTKGLMFRKELAENDGMIFVFMVDAVHHFWMKNTYIPLDLLFVDSNLKVVGIVENLTPLSEEPRGVDIKNRYVVELKAGVVKKFGIAVGSHLELQDQLDLPRE